jgi:ankyrin repeat protein
MVFKRILFTVGTGVVMAALSFGAAADTRLADAIMNGDKAQVRTLLQQKADVNGVQPDGSTALHWAASKNDLETVNLLLKAGASAKAANRYGITPLAEAALSGSGAVIEALLKAGADANALVTEDGETALMAAARVGNLEGVRSLLEHGADVNRKEGFRNQTALMWAAAEGHADVIKLLVAKGADLNALSTDRETAPPKMQAATPLAPIYRGGLSAFVLAARQGHIDAVKALLDAGADINKGDVDGNSALTFAILNKHYDLAKVLLDRNANPNAASKDGRTPLYTLVDVMNEDASPRPPRKETDVLTANDILNVLLDKGANVNAQLTAPSPIKKFAQDNGDRNLAAGATAFMRAARSADLATMKLLLSKGADPKLANKDGLNALMLAAGMNYSDRQRGTPEEALAAVKLCVESGIDVNAITEKGDTALHGAALRGLNDVIQVLADKGAKADVKNKQNFTPYDIAMGKGGFGGALREPKPATAALLKKLASGASSETVSKN